MRKGEEKASGSGFDSLARTCISSIENFGETGGEGMAERVKGLDNCVFCRRMGREILREEEDEVGLYSPLSQVLEV
jgi:hypothetical protein